jgi:fibronectin type 3 domain-containing protein
MVVTSCLRKKGTLSRMFCLSALFAAIIVILGPLSLLKAEAAQETLAWDPPTVYNDGTPVTDLAGYKLYTGNASRSYQQSVDVGNLTSYTLGALSDGATYYFAVTAYDTAGVESAYSNELSKIFPALQVTHLITATSGSGGTITAISNVNTNQASNGTTTVTSVTVNDGTSQSFSITASAGYRIVDVAVDGVSVGPVGSYSFANVTADHTIAVSFVLNSFTITASSGAGGSITPSGTTTLSYGSDQTYAIAATAGYGISDVKVDGVSVGPVASYSFASVTANHTIAANFVLNSFTIAASSGAGGSITPSGTATLNYGLNQTYAIVAAAGYAISDVKVDGVSVGPVASYSFASVSADHSIAASFALSSYTITASAGAGGSITPAGATTLNYGASQPYTIAAATGYGIADVKVDGTSVGPVGSYSFASVSANHSISATFALDSYTITASTGSGGSITPSGVTTLNFGASQSYTIAAAAGYGIADVKVDGVSVGAVSSYNFGNVTTGHSIVAAFAVSSYTISASADSYGTISPVGVTTRNWGESQTYTITPKAGYHVTSVTVDGSLVGVVTSYTFSNINANHTISATFAINTYAVTAGAGSGGAISPAGISTVNYGGSQMYSITPATGYHVSGVKVDGRSVGAVTSYLFSKVTANHKITATFAVNTRKR